MKRLLILKAKVLSRCLPTRPQNRVLLACFPKSGSTFISQKLSQLPGWTRVKFVPAYDRREQELEEAAIVRSIQNTRKINKGIVAQHHCRACEHNLALINKYDIKVIVLTRSLMDVAVSLRDHWDRESVVAPMAYLSESLLADLDASLKSRLQFIVQHIMPWYVNFYLTWVQHHPEVLGGVFFADYDRFFSNTQNHFLEVLDFVRESHDKTSIEQILQSDGYTRLNKGISGRGAKAFSEDPLAYQMLVDLLEYYPTVDFSPIFSPL